MRLRSMVTLALVLAFAVPASAQQTSIVGTATDETKAVLPGVTVTAVELSTGAQFVSVTDERGEYRLLHMAPGRYKVQAELSGFATVLVPSFELLVGQNATVPLVMKLASVTETLTVTGEAPLVDTTSSQVAGNVNPRQMEELPLQGRNWMELSKMVKGITANEITNNPGVSDDMFQLNLDGQQVTQKISGGFGQPRFSRESIAEFQIVTNMFDITQGRSAGHAGAGDLALGHEQTAGQRLRLLPRRHAECARCDHQARCCRIRTSRSAARSADRSSATSCTTSRRTSTSASRAPTFAQPSALPGQSFTTPYKNSQKSLLARCRSAAVDQGPPHRARHALGLGEPVRARRRRPPVERVGADQVRRPTSLGSWSRVLSDTRVQEVQVGYNNFQWANQGLDEVGDTFEYQLPGADARQAVQLSAVALPELHREPATT